MSVRVLRPLRVGLVASALAVVATSLVVGARSHHTVPGVAGRLVSASDTFVIAGSVTGLAPANTSTVLRLTATNLLSVPITVTSVTAQVSSVAYADGSAAPATCVSYLDPAFAGSGTAANSHTWSSLSLTVPANNTQATLTQPLVFTNASTVNQDVCKGVVFNLAYTGTATYLVTYATSTALTASANPPPVGQPVTYTATVTAAPTAGQPSPPTAPTGTVAFTDAGTPITGCAAVPVVAGSGLTSTVTCTTTFTTLAAHSVAAAFTSSDGNFAASTSPALIAAGSCVSVPTTTATTIVSGTVNGNVQVAAGQSYWLRGGTVTGSVTVAAGGKFAATGGTVRGNLVTNGDTALSGTAVTGAVTAAAGLAVSDASTVGGNLISQGTGPLCVAGSTVTGAVTAQSLRSPVTSSVCGSSVRGTLTVQSSAATFLVGSGTTCAGNAVSGNLTAQADTGPVTVQSNTVSGNLVAQSNTGAVTIGGTGLGNKVAGNITVQGNTGGGTTIGNSVTGGSCLLQSNNPQVTGSGNTVNPGALNTCNGRG